VIITVNYRSDMRAAARVTLPVSRISTLVGLNRFDSRASYWFDAVVCKLDVGMKARAESWQQSDMNDVAGSRESDDRVREREMKRARSSLDQVESIAKEDPEETAIRAHESATDRLRTAQEALKGATEQKAVARARREVDCATIALAVARSAATGAHAAAVGTVAESSIRRADALATALQSLCTPTERELTVQEADVVSWFLRVSSRLQLVGKCDGYVVSDQDPNARMPLEIKTRVQGKQPCARGPWPNEMVQMQIYLAKRRAECGFFVQRCSVAPRSLSSDHAVVVHDKDARFLVVHRVMRDDDFLRSQVWSPLEAAINAAFYALQHAELEEWRAFVLGDDHLRESALDAWMAKSRSDVSERSENC